MSIKRGYLVAMLILILCMNGFWLCFGDEEDEAIIDQETIDILAPMDSYEKEALYSAVQGFVGKFWNGSDLYPDPCGWTPIQGVTCDMYNGLWYVTDLNIGPAKDNSLICSKKPEFSPQLFDLKRLKSMYFLNCFTNSHQVSTIPTALNTWEKLSLTLESLKFRSNPSLVGEIPESLGGLKKLRSLVIMENGLSGRLPESLGRLVCLERLNLAGNNLTGPIPETFGGLGKLLILDLSQNSLSGSLPLTFGGLTSVLKVDLSNNLLEGKIPSGVFEGMKSLTLLDLSGNRLLGGLGLKELENLNFLEEFVLSNNPSLGGVLEEGVEWEKLERLAVLDLSNTGLKGEIPDSIVGLKRLRFLGLSENNLSGNLSPKLGKLPCLGSMYLNKNNFSGELKFSGLFYGKMGRRFGAWDNPNLCYPIGISVSPSHVPFGVKPCQPKVKLMEINNNSNHHYHLNHDSQDLVASFGSQGSFICSFWWLVSLELLFLIMSM